tara:strand:- start:409 stop:693 length:285 start_codon:yes stop_codon:yes gene_type:complete
MKLKKLIKESVWGKRAFGEKLPTIDDYKEAYNKKQVNEENESTWTILYKGMIGGFRKAKDKRLDVVAKAVAFFIKTEYGIGAKNDFIKKFKKML